MMSGVARFTKNMERNFTVSDIVVALKLHHAATAGLRYVNGDTVF